MTRYSRSVIPGRTREAENEIDRMVFGRGEPEREDAANDEGEEEIPVPKRRRGRRANDDFPPLPSGTGRREPPENKRAPLVMLGVIVTLGVFGVVVWNAYSNGVRSEGETATPEIADAGPFKVRAKPAATEPTPPEQATVFERVEAASKAKADVKPTPDVRAEATPPAAAPTPAPVKTVAATPAPAAAKVEPPKPAPAKAETPKPVTAPVQVVTATPPPLAVPAVAPAAVPAGGYKPAFATGGNYLVQVAAPSTEEAAGAEWAKRAKAMPELFGSAEKYIIRADVSGRTVYRVRAGSFATTADADAFCNAIKAKGGDCFRVAK